MNYAERCRNEAKAVRTYDSNLTAKQHAALLDVAAALYEAGKSTLQDWDDTMQLVLKAADAAAKGAE